MSQEENTKSTMHYFYVELADLLGVDAALMLNHLIYWIATNSMKRINYIDGRFWTYSTIEDFKQYFPYWSTAQIRRILKNLAFQEVIIRGNHNKCKYDRTLWYALKDEIGILEIYNPFDELELWEECYNIGM